jgi:hypothetical protein
MAGSYASDLNVVGAVLGSPVGDLGHTFRRLNGTYMSGLPALVVAALADIYPDLKKVIDDHATDEGKELLRRLHNMTTAEAVIRLAKKDMGDMLDQPLDEVLKTPLCDVFDDIKLGAAVPTPPCSSCKRSRPADLRRTSTNSPTPISRAVLDDLPPRPVQRASPAAPAVGADDAALADRPLQRQASQ